jgi:hypothetical protein
MQWEAHDDIGIVRIEGEGPMSSKAAGALHARTDSW